MNTSEGTAGVETHCLSAYDLGEGESLSLTSEVCFNLHPPTVRCLCGGEKGYQLTKVMLHPLEESKKLAHLITKTDFLPQSLQK